MLFIYFFSLVVGEKLLVSFDKIPISLLCFLVPFRLVPFRPVPFRSGPFHSVPFRSNNRAITWSPHVNTEHVGLFHFSAWLQFFLSVRQFLSLLLHSLFFFQSLCFTVFSSLDVICISSRFHIFFRSRDFLRIACVYTIFAQYFFLFLFVLGTSGEGGFQSRHR